MKGGSKNVLGLLLSQSTVVPNASESIVDFSLGVLRSRSGHVLVQMDDLPFLKIALPSIVF